MIKRLANKLIVYPHTHFSDGSQLSLVLNPYILHSDKREIPHVPIFLFDYTIEYRKSPKHPWGIIQQSRSGFADLKHPLLEKFNLDEIRPYFKWNATNYSAPPNYFENAKWRIGLERKARYEEVFPVNLDAFLKTVFWGLTPLDGDNVKEELQTVFDIAVGKIESHIHREIMWDVVHGLLVDRLPYVMASFFADMDKLFKPEFSSEDFIEINMYWKERWGEYIYR